MCGAGLKRLSALLLLFSVLSLSPCFAEVVLTDAEAEEILTEIIHLAKEVIILSLFLRISEILLTTITTWIAG